MVFSFLYFQVIDSWEEISAENAPQLPKTAIKIESPPKKVDIPIPDKNVDPPAKKPEPQSKKSEKKPAKKVVTEAKLIDKMSELSITKDKPP